MILLMLSSGQTKESKILIDYTKSHMKDRFQVHANMSIPVCSFQKLSSSALLLDSAKTNIISA